MYTYNKQTYLFIKAIETVQDQTFPMQNQKTSSAIYTIRKGEAMNSLLVILLFSYYSKCCCQSKFSIPMYYIIIESMSC